MSLARSQAHENRQRNSAPFHSQRTPFLLCRVRERLLRGSSLRFVRWDWRERTSFWGGYQAYGCPRAFSTHVLERPDANQGLSPKVPAIVGHGLAVRDRVRLVEVRVMNHDEVAVVQCIRGENC